MLKSPLTSVLKQVRSSLFFEKKSETVLPEYDFEDQFISYGCFCKDLAPFFQYPRCRSWRYKSKKDLETVLPEYDFEHQFISYGCFLKIWLLFCSIQGAGLGGMKPNTIILGWPNAWRKREEESWRVFVDTIRNTAAAKMALLVPKGVQRYPDSGVSTIVFIIFY